MKIKQQTIIATIVSSIVFLPYIVLAASNTYLGLVPCDNVTTVCDFSQLITLANNIINWFLGISVSVAAITFSIAGWNILSHPDDSGKIKEGKDMLFKTVVGMVIILGAWLALTTALKVLVNPDTKALRFLQGN